ncbi:hypothetical protein ACIHEI_34010 [Kitasatospora sp. NPDC051984]|uniref:hypothetical protein n=1 Tax=Kitasatospora sp. NPDC051984 TaxID=3364059 RepID=UPI0037C83F5E
MTATTNTPAPQPAQPSSTMPSHDLYRAVETTVSQVDTLNAQVTEHLGSLRG